MQHVSIPNGTLLRLAPYLSSLLPESEHELNADVQYLFRELAAAAKCAGMEELSDNLLTTDSGASSPRWASSSTAVDAFSRAGSLAAMELDSALPNAFNNSLPPSSPPQPPSSPPQLPSSPPQSPLHLNLDDLTAETENPRDDIGMRGTKRTRSASDAADSGCDAGPRDDRAKRVALQTAARHRDEDRMCAAQAARVMGHNWTPDCCRAGGRMPGAVEVMARELYDGVPLVHSSDGPAPDPSVSLDNGYAPGVGGGLSGEILNRSEDDGCAPGVGGGLNGESVDKSVDDRYAPGVGGGLSREIMDRPDGDGDGEAGGMPMKSKAKAKAKSKSKAKGVDWQKVVQKTRLKEDAVTLIALLSDVSTVERQHDLCSFVDALTRDSSVTESNTPATAAPGPSVVSPIARAVLELEILRADSQIMSFRTMIKAMQLSILVDVELNKLKTRRGGVRKVWAAAQSGILYEAFRRHQVAGFRLLELASGCSIYIIFIIAALKIRTQFINATVSQISGIANAFREPPLEGPWSTIISTVIIPRLRFLQLHRVPGSFVDVLLWRPSKTAESGREYLQLSDLSAADKALGKINQHNFFLLERSPTLWSIIPPQALPFPPTTSQSPYIVDAVTVTAPWVSGRTPCPVTRANRDQWTETERQKAEDRVVATDLEDLQKLLNEQVPPDFKGARPSTGGFEKKYPYIGIPSPILCGKTLKVEDIDGDLLTMLSTHASTVLKEQCEAIMAQLQLAFPDELFDVDTASDPLFQFFAMHFTWYNRYYESGEGAPAGIHPDQLIREGAVKANFSQRAPRESDDIRKHPALYRQVTSLLQDVLEFIRCNIEHHLPQVYKELEIHCEFLPLHDEAPARPFTSMVVNLCACTKGHRDKGDKTWCTTFTIGECEGGEICLHEAGLVLDSRPGDMIVFQSQKETHFNLHMKGVRSTVVLHSDRTMDAWTGGEEAEGDDPPYNRWGSHIH